ncbi:BTAD domain-containing putative transcriptional regulator [Lentzea sp. HUAS12]|uniref:AfsR/SARP family transcriptional regulator n=1 Tax=Lentzea sp. HUAS12 TaxID=2951806 RepID=UPI00209F4F26|nr:BTAD domain-containing putative transcriptional regulator [Lentzea sp. HUAS12]USX54573.1 tetratricopeptide repeat protein [Lentzea sp. HUAS12]
MGTRSADLGALKQRALLTVLLLNVARPVAVETLVKVLWPDRERVSARKNLQVQICRMRKALVNSGVQFRVRREGDAYRLDLDSDLVDYHRFGRLVAAGRAANSGGDHSRAKRLLFEAIGLWGGIPLADVRGDWGREKRSAMVANDLLRAYHALFEAQLRLSEHAEVLDRLVPLSEQHPLDETLARFRMLAMEGLGDRNGATAFYVRFRRLLFSEYGNPPALELERLYSRMLETPQADVRAAGPTPPAYDFPRVRGLFTGRVALLDRLDAFLDARTYAHPPAVVLHGMPAVGKTRLAVHWANEHGEHFAGGRVLLDMRGYGPDEPLTADNALSLLLERLGVPVDHIPIAAEHRSRALRRALAGGGVLLVLDNVRDAEQVRSLLDAAGEAFVLLTSRDRLPELVINEGAYAVAVPELPHAECVDLLKGMIGQDRAAQDRRGLDELVVLSGGLPLALKIIGQHVADRPLETLTELAGQFRAHRTLISGHEEAQSLDAVFSWSYQALAPDTARVFRAVGLHPGPRLHGDSAAALAGITPTWANRCLRLLARVHLLDHDIADRYRFHDLLHQYAAERAHEIDAPGERRQAVERLLTWYTETAMEVFTVLSPQSPRVPPLPASCVVVDRMIFSSDEAALEWCAIERENIVAVTRLAADSGFHEYAWRLPAALHEVSERSGYHDDMLACHEIALESAKATGDGEAEMGTRNNLGLLYLNVHRIDDAYRQFAVNLAMARRTCFEWCEAVSLNNIGIIHFERGDDRTALRYYRESLPIHRRLGLHEGEAYQFHRIGMALHRLGEFAEARASYVEALRIRLEIGHVRGQGATLTALAALHQELGEPEIGLEYCLQGLRAHRTTGDRVETCKAQCTRAAIEYDLGMLDEAREHAGQAAALAEELHELHTAVKSLHLTGHLLTALGDPEAAVAAWMRALDLCPSSEGLLRDTLREHLGLKID